MVFSVTGLFRDMYVCSVTYLYFIREKSPLLKIKIKINVGVSIVSMNMSMFILYWLWLSIMQHISNCLTFKRRAMWLGVNHGVASSIVSWLLNSGLSFLSWGRGYGVLFALKLFFRLAWGIWGDCILALSCNWFFNLYQKKKEVCEVLDDVLVYVFHQALYVTFWDVEVFGLWHWALMHDASDSCDNGYKGIYFPAFIYYWIYE